MNVTTTPQPAARDQFSTRGAMKALVYLGPGKNALEERPRPDITASTDAIVKITKTTICGTDLHILKGDVPSGRPSRRSSRETGS
jgi:threonine dehydrogenase-like Zn-dependent dehydrogenase